MPGAAINPRDRAIESSGANVSSKAISAVLLIARLQKGLATRKLYPLRRPGQRGDIVGATPAAPTKNRICWAPISGAVLIVFLSNCNGFANSLAYPLDPTHTLDGKGQK